MLGTATLSLLAAGGLSTCQPGGKQSRTLVTRFYTEALVERKVRPAFEAYVAPEFVEHKPDIASADRSGAIAFLEGLVTELPAARWELLRVTGTAELVAVHARFTPAPGAQPYAIADFFRIRNCRIIEHWDVIAGPPAQTVNPLSRF